MKTPKSAGEWLEAYADLEDKFGRVPNSPIRGALVGHVLEPLKEGKNPYERFKKSKTPAEGAAEGPYFNRFPPANAEHVHGKRIKIGAKKPPNADLAEKMRNYMMDFGVAVGLSQLDYGGLGALTKVQVGRQLASAALAQPSCAALQPAREISTLATGNDDDGHHDPRTDYACTLEARTFFGATLPAALDFRDQEFGTRLSKGADGPYDPSSDESIAQWSRIWTAAVSLETIDWLWGKVEKDSVCREAARKWWIILCQDQKLVYNPGRGATLPIPLALSSDKSKVPRQVVSLNLRPILAQVLKYHPDRRMDGKPSDYPVRIRIDKLSYDEGGQRIFYPCHNIRQIRFAILAECLLSWTERLEEGDGGAPQIGGDPRAPDDSTTFNVLGAAGERCLGHAEVARAARKGGPSTSDVPGGGMRDLGGLPLGRYLDGKSLEGVPPPGPPGLKAGVGGPRSLPCLAVDFQIAAQDVLDYWGADLALGSVELFDNLRPETVWVDITAVLRSKGGEHLVGLVVESDMPPVDDVAGDSGHHDPAADAVDASAEGSSVQYLVLSTPLPNGIDPQDLRTALGDSARTFWAYEYTGLGVTIVVLVDLDP